MNRNCKYAEEKSPRNWVQSNQSPGHPSVFPHVGMQWTRRELQSLAKLISHGPAKPMAALIRAMKEVA